MPVASKPVKRVTCRVVIMIGVMAISSPALVGAARAGESASLKELNHQIREARAAVDDAAARFTEAQLRYEELDDEIILAESRIAATEAEVSELQAVVEQRAVEAYQGEGSATAIIVLADDDLLDSVRKTKLLDGLNDQDRTDIDRLAALRNDLAQSRDDLAAKRQEQADIVDATRVEQDELNSRLAEAVEARDHLKAQLQREASTPPPPASTAPTTAGPGTVIDGPVSSGDGPIIGGLMCPVPGASFTDTWGEARTGGRTHAGTDMFAPRGTPDIAVVSGSVSFSSDPAGGNAAYLAGSDGNVYFYAHLDSFVGSPRGVSQGEVIGTVGDSGNAVGTHTHFEIRVGGGSPVNPYPTLSSIC